MMIIRSASITLIRIVLMFIMLLPAAMAESFVGQWHIYQEGNKAIAQTIDGFDKLKIEVTDNMQTRIVLSLHEFGSFGTTDNVLEYASPIYGRIRTGNYLIKNQQIIIEDVYEVQRFIQNLRDISSHLIMAAENMGYSFTERKISIAYVNNHIPPILKRSQFSTIEIDEVLELLGITEYAG
ncbi:hypothetical protein [Thalassotalea fusca]